MESMAKYIAALLLLLFISQDCLVVGSPVAAGHKIERRAIDKIIGFVNSNFSDCAIGDCSGSVPAGLQTLSRQCLDQDSIKHPICNSMITENCCDLNSFFSVPVYVPCNPCGSTVDPILPIGTFQLTNGDGSTTIAEITVEGSITTIVTNTSELDGGMTIITTVVEGLQRSFSAVITPPPPVSFDVQVSVGTFSAVNTFRIDEMDILIIPTENNVARKTIVGGDVFEYESGVANLSNSDVFEMITENANTLYYISPLGLSYTFSGDKLTRAMGEGLYFVDSANNVAIFSQYQPATDVLLQNFVDTYQIQNQTGNEIVFRINGVRNLFINNITELTTSNEILEYSNGLLATSAGNTAAAAVFILGSTGFEFFDNDPSTTEIEGATFISNYDAVFFNDMNGGEVLISTSPSLSQDIRQAFNFASDSNNQIDNNFQLNGSTITFQGVEILDLTTTERIQNSGGRETLVYTGDLINFISMGGTRMSTKFFFRQNNGLLASISRSSVIPSLEDGGVIYIDGKGNALAIDTLANQLFTDDVQFIDNSLNAVMNPGFPTAMPSATFSLVREGMQVFLQIQSMNVLAATSENCMTVSTPSTGTVSLNNGIIEIFDGSSSSTTSITGVTMLTVAINGENVQLLTDANTGFSTPIDSSYLFRVCNDKAILTNDTSVRSLIDSAATLPGVILLNNMRTLFIGSMQVLPLNTDVAIRDISANNAVRLRAGQLTISDQNGPIEIINTLTNGLVSLIDGTVMFIPSTQDMTISNTPGMLYAIQGDRGFFTNDAMIMDILTNEFATGVTVATDQTTQQTVLRAADDSDIIILNGVESINIASDESLRFDPSTNRLEILNSSNVVTRSFAGANNVRSFLLGGPATVQMLSSMMTINGPLSLLAQSASGDYFITDNPFIQDRVNGALPVPSQSVSAVDGGSNNIILTIGALIFDVNKMESILANTQVQYSNSTLTFGSTTLPINEFLTYRTTDFMPQSNMGSAPDTFGPGQLYYNVDWALFTDRQDVIDAVSSITPAEPPTVIARPESGSNRVVLVIGGQDVITLNEREIVPVTSVQRIEFTGSGINIRNTNDNSLVTSFDGITSITRYLDGETAPQTFTDPQLITDTPGQLVLTSTGAFYSNRADVNTVLEMEFDLLTGVDDNGNIIIGGETVIQLNNSARIDVDDNEEVVISGEIITIRDRDTNTIIRTFTGISNQTRYLSSDRSPIPNPGDATIAGPVTIVVDNNNGQSIITNRPEVIRSISNILSGTTIPSLTFGLRDRNGTSVLVIDALDIIAIDDGIIRMVIEAEEVSYNSTNTVVSNFIGGIETGSPNPLIATRLVRYLSTDSSPVTFMNTGPTSNGPLTLFYQPNDSPSTVFLTDRPDIVMLLNEASENLTAAATPAPVTPEPPSPIDPQEPIITINDDDTRWTMTPWSDCSRPCGVGIRIRAVMCRTRPGAPSIVCDQPGQRSANDIPTSVELCDIVDCPGEEQRNGVPRDETITFSSGAGLSDIRAIVRISNSNITNEIYTIETVSLERITGSIVQETIENIDGVQTRVDSFELRTELVPLVNDVIQDGSTLQLQINGETLFVVNPVPRDSFPGDQCFAVPEGEVIDYRDRTLQYDSNIFNDILVVITSEGVLRGSNSVPTSFTFPYMENLQSIDFGDRSGLRPAFGIDGGGVVCVSPAMGSAFIGGLTDPAVLSTEVTDNFITSVVSAFNMISSSLSSPMIMSGESSPMEEITTSGRVIPIGTPVVEVREDIFYFSLRCRLSNQGNPPSSDRVWTVDGVEIPNNNIKYSITSDTLLIKNINEDDEGNYTCSVSNPIGTDEATTEVIVNDKPSPMRPDVVSPTDPTPPSPPDWVPEPFSDCSELCGVGIRVRAVICRDSNGQQSQDCDGTNVPQIAELCNTQDCPGGPARSGVPPVNVTEFVVPIFNGYVNIIVNVSSSDPTTGNYMLIANSAYPDQTTILQMLTNMDGVTMVTTTTVFGQELLFGKVDSIRTGDRIDINSGGRLLHSVLPQLGDMCFEVASDEQFLYSNDRIIYKPNTFEYIRLLIGAENEGESFTQESTNRVFTGPLTLCVSPSQNRAFYTDIPTLADTIITQYNNILANFTAPMISRVNANETVVVVEDPSSTTFTEIGQTIRAPESSQIYITVPLSEPGNTIPFEVTWTFNGEPLEMDTDKGIFFTSGRYTLIIDEVSKSRVGQYEATVRNAVGSDSVTSSVILQPTEGIIVEGRMSTPPVFNIGIGTNRNIDRATYTSSDLFCEVETNETSADIRFLVNGVEASTGTPSDVTVTTGATSAVLSRSPLVDGTTVYTCEATVRGNVTFRETSVVNVMAVTPPTNITFTGNTQINVGESSTIQCSADGSPEPIAMFNEVRLGMDGIVSDFVISGDMLIINKAVYRDDSQYCCTATNEAGSVTDCVIVTLMIPPTITRPTESEVSFVPLPEGTPFPLESPLPMFFAMVGQMVTIPRGSILQIRCESVGSPVPTIMWVVNGGVIPEGTFGVNYTIDGAQPEDAGTYECRVSSAAGNDSLTTVVTVVSPPIVRPSGDDITELTTPDTVVTVKQTSDLFVLDGLDFCIRCDFDPGSPPADTVQWLRNGDNINRRDACLSFAENRTQLCFEGITRPYSDVYSCRVSNIAGSDEGSISVTVAESPRIAFPNHRMLPAPGQCDSQFDRSFVSEDVGVNLCVSPATRVLVDCAVNGEPKPAATIEWRFNETGQVLSNNDTGITILPNNSLLIESINQAEGVGGSGTYICRAFNFAGSHERSSTIRASGVAPVIDTTRVSNPIIDNRFITTVGSAAQTVTLQSMTEIHIFCNSEGSPSPQITWSVNGIPIIDDAELFNILSDGSLLISGLINTECSQYNCTASNPLGQESESITICGETFACLHSGYGECSQTCGIGIREATFECNRTFDGISSPFNYFFIPTSIRPVIDPATCGPGDLCPQQSFRFVASDFSECSKSCGCGRQYRTVRCFNFLGEEQLEEVDYQTCSYQAIDQTLPAPLSQVCNNFTCPEWRVGNFSECTQECGSMGNQTRQVSCVAPDNGDLIVADSFCDANGRPSDYQRCNRFHCPYQFIANAWTPCSTTCRGGVRTRTISCYNAKTSELINDTLCVRELGEERRPTTIHLCGTGSCPAQFVWSAGSYGPCSVTCGNGVRSRSVQCISTNDLSTVADNMCIENRRPEELTTCFSIACPGADCVSEYSLCGVIANMGLCSVVRPNCCISCPV